VFQLGFIFHFLLNPNAFRQPINNPPKIEKSRETNPATPALRLAMELAFTVNVAKRPTAREIGSFLDNSLSEIQRSTGT
jgi:hypothetical protein